MSFEDRLAHKLYRRYSKDEAVAFLKGKLDEARQEIASLEKDLKSTRFSYGEMAVRVSMYKRRMDEMAQEHDEMRQLLEEARSKLGHEKKQERSAFRETEAGKRLARLNKEVREQRNRHREWRDKYFDLANTVARGDIELAKAKAKRLITPTEPEQAPESASTSNWWDEFLHDIGIYIKKTVNPKKK